jgi:predicted alpha/beta-hydrolase family hydrolase
MGARIFRSKRKLFRLIWVICGISFTIWLAYSTQSKGVERHFTESNSSVQVLESADFYMFTPSGLFRKVFIFYPGALVDPKAYVPLCRKIADHGYKVCLVKMPWRLASRGYRKPLGMKLFEDTTKKYILAGHSQGAKMAAQFVYENPALIDGLILLATTHPRDIDLSGIRIPVMKIYGLKDGVADPGDVVANKSKLPASTRYVSIEGANHAQFGYYGPQLGDDQADITLEVQQNIILANILSFLDQI